MEDLKIDLSKNKNTLSRNNQITQLLWTIVWTFLSRYLSKSIGSGWKRFMLELFGAKIHSTAVVYSSVKIYMSCNLIMEEYSCLASNVHCYNVNFLK